MSSETTVADLFRRAREIREKNPGGDFKQVTDQLASEFAGKPMPPVYNLTIPEFDDVVPEEDWTAGLPIVMRGIQNDDWKEIALGIVICLEQIENFQKESGPEQMKRWHDRSKGIGEQTKKSLDKWLPEDLMRIAERSQKR
jgi:hypothetical protein